MATKDTKDTKKQDKPAPKPEGLVCPACGTVMHLGECPKCDKA